MNTEFIEVQEAENEKQGLSLEDLGLLCLSHWHWFAISLLIALSAAVFKILTTTPIYTRTSSLLIKDDQNQKGVAAVQEFADLGLIGGHSNVNNEMQTISAPIMMQEVARRLHLDVEMTVPQRLHQRPLYNDAPVSLQLGADVDKALMFTCKLTLNETQAVLSDIETNFDELQPGTITLPLGRVVKTSLGTLSVAPTENFSPEWYDKTIHLSKTSIKAAGGLYNARLSVSLGDEKRESSILQLSLVDEVPERAEDILLTLIQVYNENWVKDKNLVAESTADFINKRLESIGQELGDVDRDISAYKSQNLLPDVSASTGMIMNQSNQNYTQMLQLNNELAMEQYLKKHLETLTDLSALLPANTIGNAGTENLITAYNKMVLERNEVLTNSSEENAFVKTYDSQLLTQRAAILRSLGNLIAQTKAKINNMQRAEEETNRKIADNPKQANRLLSIERQQKVKETLYIYLLQKREENELSKAYTAYNSRVIQPPIGSSFPTEPRRRNILLIAVLLGLCIPAGILYLRETLNKTVRGRKDVDDMAAPLLGEIPNTAPKRHWWQRKPSEESTRKILIEAGNRNVINESFRLVRTKLDFMLSGDADKKVVMLTSFNPGSGKTFITANIAKTVALKKKRVLAIDMDLRRCSLSLMCSEKRQTGLSQYLNSHDVELADIIVNNAFGDGVDLVPVGIIPPNPTELLLSDRIKELFQYARENYDYVFVDCPPIEIVADASIIKDNADVTIFVIRVGVMDRRMLKDVDNLYKENRYNNMSLLINGTDFVSSRYGSYRYGYSYGYSYNRSGYGYGRKGSGNYGYYGNERSES